MAKEPSARAPSKQRSVADRRLELFDTLARLRRELNPELAIEGLLLTMFDERTNLSTAVAKDSLNTESLFT